MGSNFTFFPQSLQKERAKAEKSYQSIEEQVLQARSPMVLPRLLESIQNMEKEKVVSFSKDLSTFDIKLIMRGYPFLKASWKVRQNINHILIERYQSWIGEEVWELFQQECQDPVIEDLINRIFQNDRGSFLWSSDTTEFSFMEVFQHQGGPLVGIGEFLIRNNRLLRENLSLLKINEGSNLETFLIYYMFYNGLRSNWIINREGIHQIVNHLSGFPKETYKELLQSYLENRQMHQFHNEILSQALYLLKDPRIQPIEWTFLNGSELGKVKSWLIQRELKTYFHKDNQRYEFWGKYSRYIEKVFKLESPNIIFLHFDRFVVMEFGEEGAAHFYGRKGFEEFILPVISSMEFVKTQNVTKKESMIKITTPYKNGIKLFITKLNHTKNWEANFSEFLKEHFDLS